MAAQKIERLALSVTISFIALAIAQTEAADQRGSHLQRQQAFERAEKRRFLRAKIFADAIGAEKLRAASLQPFLRLCAAKLHAGFGREEVESGAGDDRHANDAMVEDEERALQGVKRFERFLQNIGGGFREIAVGSGSGAEVRNRL